MKVTDFNFDEVNLVYRGSKVLVLRVNKGFICAFKGDVFLL